MTEPDRKLRERLRCALEGADTQLAAYVLHDLAKDYFVKYASEVGEARYKCGTAEGFKLAEAERQ